MEKKNMLEAMIQRAEQDFGKIKPFVPDTSYNYHYYDYPFQRNDVNATWLGVAGSPVQYYDWFKRRSDEGVEFYDALESCCTSTIRQVA